MARESPEQRLDALDALFSALGHRARRHILLTLWFRGGEMSAGDIARRFQCAWPTTTRHLKVLLETGLVTHERRGQARLYRIDPGKLSAVKGWLGWFDDKKRTRRA